MNLIISGLCAILLIASLNAQSDIDAGTRRLNTLRNRSLTADSRIVEFAAKDFNEFVMKYPRPYDVVIYFHAKQIPLSSQLYPQFNYTVQLYLSQGAIDAEHNPTFFVRMNYTQQTHRIFKKFQFESAPNLVVSKPHMAVVSQIEEKSYLKDYKWRISQTDGVVTTLKLLEFINKRTHKSIEYKETQQTIEYVLKMFFGIAVGAVIVYKLLKFIWNHWFFWYLASIIAYMVCMSGIVYCIIHDSIQSDLKQTGSITFFSGRGSRQQTFYEGCLISGLVSLTGIVLVLIVMSGQKLRERYSAIVGVLGIVLVYYLISYVESVYTKKGWYGPSYQPPSGYLKGPLSVDQGNNI